MFGGKNPRAKKVLIREYNRFELVSIRLDEGRFISPDTDPARRYGQISWTDFTLLTEASVKGEVKVRYLEDKPSRPAFRAAAPGRTSPAGSASAASPRRLRSTSTRRPRSAGGMRRTTAPPRGSILTFPVRGAASPRTCSPTSSRRSTATTSRSTRLSPSWGTRAFGSARAPRGRHPPCNQLGAEAHDSGLGGGRP